jgi:hypothetical protein
MKKEFELKPIEKGISISEVTGNSRTRKTLAIEERLLSMTPQEDSFIVEGESEANVIRLVGKRIGRTITTRKMYVQEDVKNQRLSDLKPVFRIWVKEITEPVSKLSAPLANLRNVNNDKAVVPGHILEIAELKAENRMIVEDLDKIKKIIKEELGSHHEFKFPLETSEDPEPLNGHGFSIHNPKSK